MGEVKYIVANNAARQSTAAALAGTTRATDLRVLLAVHSLTLRWSRLEERRSLGQIAKAAGFELEDDLAKQHTIERRVAKSLARLAELGAVIYKPSHGRGRLSVIGVPMPKGDSEDPYWTEEKGSLGTRKGVSRGPEKGSPQTPTQAGTQVPATSRGRRQSRTPFGDGSAWADHPGGKVDL